MVGRGALLVLGSVVSVQVGQAIGKHLFADAGALGTVALRLGIAAIVLLGWHRPALPGTRKDFALVAGFGAAIAGMNLIYPALTTLPLGMATTLQLLGPILLALLTSRGLAEVGAAGFAGFGVWLFHGPGGGAPFAGIAFALASGASMAAYLLLSRTAGRRSETASTLSLAVAFAAILWLPAGIAQSGAALLAPEVLLVGALVAVLSAVVPYSLDLAALRRIPPRTVGVLESLEPAVGAIAGLVVLSEVLSAPQWVAITCVCTAGVVAVTGSREARSRSAA